MILIQYGYRIYSFFYHVSFYFVPNEEAKQDVLRRTRGALPNIMTARARVGGDLSRSDLLGLVWRRLSQFGVGVGLGWLSAAEPAPAGSTAVALGAPKFD